MATKEKIVKKRYWGMIVYPESAPENWRDILRETGLEVAISPLHNKDINPSTGEPKKDHWHCLLCYNGPTTFNAVKVLTDALNTVIPKPVDSVRGAYRYFTHMDDPDKAPYDAEDITTLNGFVATNHFELSRSEIVEIKKNIQQLIRDENIIEYCDLLDHLVDAELWDWLDVAYNNTMMLNSYIKSRKYKAQEQIKEAMNALML